MLDAYQMSVSSCLQQPQVSLLRSQMAGRLLAVRPSAFQVGLFLHTDISLASQHAHGGSVPFPMRSGLAVSSQQSTGRARNHA